MKNQIKIIHLKNERETVANIRDSKVKELEILNKYLWDIDKKIQEIKDIEIFLNEVEKALENGWAGSTQEKNNFKDIIKEVRDGDASACEMLRNVFKPNESFKKETARFKNV